jgi:hypothetical protein
MPIELAPEQEECATWFAAILETDHASNPVFCKNFFDDWKRLLRNPKVTFFILFCSNQYQVFFLLFFFRQR